MRKYKLVEFKVCDILEDVGVIVFTIWKEQRNIFRYLSKAKQSEIIEFFCSKNGKEWKRYLYGDFVAIEFNVQLVKAFGPFRARYIEYLEPKIHYFEITQ